MTLGLRFGPYLLKARRTQTACLRLVATVDACVWNWALRVFNSSDVAGSVAGGDTVPLAAAVSISANRSVST